MSNLCHYCRVPITGPGTNFGQGGHYETETGYHYAHYECYMKRVIYEGKPMSQPLSQDYKPRNDMVIVRKVKVDTIKGLYMPEVSAQSKSWEVVAIGPKVEDLKVGDSVLMLGSGDGSTVAMTLPNDPDYLIIEQKCLLVRYRAAPPTERN